MPTSSSDQGLTLPIGSDLQGNSPNEFSDYNAGVESRLVKRYASVADRTTRNATPSTPELSLQADTEKIEVYSIANASWEGGFRHLLVPGATGTRTTNLSIPSGTTTVTGSASYITLPNQAFDNSSMFTVNDPYITVPYAGLYAINFYVQWEVSNTGERFAYIDLVTAGTTFEVEGTTSSTQPGKVNGHLVYPLIAAEQVRLRAKQTSGVGRNVTAAHLSVVALAT